MHSRTSIPLASSRSTLRLGNSIFKLLQSIRRYTFNYLVDCVKGGPPLRGGKGLTADIIYVITAFLLASIPQSERLPGRSRDGVTFLQIMSWDHGSRITMAQ